MLNEKHLLHLVAEMAGVKAARPVGVFGGMADPDHRLRVYSILFFAN